MRLCAYQTFEKLPNFSASFLAFKQQLVIGDSSAIFNREFIAPSLLGAMNPQLNSSLNLSVESAAPTV